MRSNAGAGPLLVQAALREHNRLVDNELTSESWDKAAWLFRQEIRLRNGVDPGSEDLSLLLYQFATLQYTRWLSRALYSAQVVHNIKVLSQWATCCKNLLASVILLSGRSKRCATTKFCGTFQFVVHCWVGSSLLVMLLYDQDFNQSWRCKFFKEYCATWSIAQWYSEICLIVADFFGAMSDSFS